MAGFSGFVTPALLVDQTHQVARGRFNYNGEFASLEALGATAFGDQTDVGSGHPPAPAQTALVGMEAKWETIGFDWFDKVHLIPRKVFAFGVVVSQVTDTFELFSAHKVDISLTAVNNNLTPDVTVPDIPTPVATLTSFTSFTDGSSTRLNYVAADLVVAKDGAPLFDDTIEFVFSTGESPEIRVTGSRISLITAIYEADVEENWEFVSDRMEWTNGSAQVVSLVANPIQSFRVNFRLLDEERQRLQVLLQGAQSQLLALPVWTDDVFSTASASATDTSLAVEDTTDVDLRVGGLAVVFESATKFDVVVLSAVATNLITFTTTPLLNSYSSDARVAPVRIGYIFNEPSGERYTTKLERFRFTFVVTDNDTGMFSGSTTGWGSYSGKVLLDDCNLMAQRTVSQRFSQRVHLVDNRVGAIHLTTDWPTNSREGTKGFMMQSRADIMKVKKLLLSLRGPQVSFRIPTFIEDMTVVADLGAAANVMDISHIGYTKFSNGLEPKKVFRITFTDGTSLEREIQSSTELTSTTERLTLDTTWPASRTVAEIERVQFLELTRFSTENFRFRYDRPGLARLQAATQTLVSE